MEIQIANAQWTRKDALSVALGAELKMSATSIFIGLQKHSFADH